MKLLNLVYSGCCLELRIAFVNHCFAGTTQYSETLTVFTEFHYNQSSSFGNYAMHMQI